MQKCLLPADKCLVAESRFMLHFNLVASSTMNTHGSQMWRINLDASNLELWLAVFYMRTVFQMCPDQARKQHNLEHQTNRAAKSSRITKFRNREITKFAAFGVAAFKQPPLRGVSVGMQIKSKSCRQYANECESWPFNRANMALPTDRDVGNNLFECEQCSQCPVVGVCYS